MQLPVATVKGSLKSCQKSRPHRLRYACVVLCIASLNALQCSKRETRCMHSVFDVTQIIVAEIEDNDALLHMAQSTRCNALSCY